MSKIYAKLSPMVRKMAMGDFFQRLYLLFLTVAVTAGY